MATLNCTVAITVYLTVSLYMFGCDLILHNCAPWVLSLCYWI